MISRVSTPKMTTFGTLFGPLLGGPVQGCQVVVDR